MPAWVRGSVAETALLHGGTLRSLPHHELPTEPGVAAIDRF
jgi:hypothetical protein